MGINLEEICRAISRYNPKVFLCNKEFAVINAVTLLDKNQKQLERDILYIGEASDLTAASKINSPANLLICLSGISIPEEYEIPEQVNWVTVDGVSNPSEILFKMRNFFEKHNRVLQDSIALYNASLAGKGLQHIVDTAGKVLGNPIFVADISFKVLAFTKDTPVLIPFWQKEIEKGYLSHDSIKSAKREGIISKVYQTGNPVLLEFYQCPRLSERIDVDGEIAGFISILEYEKPFEEGDSELVPLLCRIISSELKKDSFLKYARGIMYDTLIFDLLNEKNISTELLDSRIKSLNLKLSKYLYILNAKFLKNSPDNLPLPYVRNALESRVSRSTGVIYSDTIVLLIARDIKEPLSAGEWDILNALLQEMNMAGGLSLSFNGISHIKSHYLQACAAIELGMRLGDSKAIFLYENYSFYHLLSIAAHNIDIKIFCSPLLTELLEYDRQNKTRFAESLYVYLSSGCNAAESARMFNIHRNSMDYRIRKIEGLLNIKISNPDITFVLSLSFKILLLTGEKDFLNCTHS